MAWATCLALAFGTEQPPELPLWPADRLFAAPAGAGPEDVKENGAAGTDRHVRNVYVPTLTVYQPDPAKKTGAACVVCPGGGYHILALDKEGHDVARQLASTGVLGVVLKYRLPKPNGHVFSPDTPFLDAQRALRTVRGNAAEWGVDPKKVGIMGFSAGGHLAATAAVHGEDGKPDAADPLDRLSGRPDFAVLVYPVVTFKPPVGHAGSGGNLLGPNPDAALIDRYSLDQHVGPRTPPTFMVHTWDDPVSADNSLAFAAALRKAKRPAEPHLFAWGGHGYGIRTEWQGAKNPPISQWPTLLEQWLKTRAFAPTK